MSATSRHPGHDFDTVDSVRCSCATACGSLHADRSADLRGLRRAGHTGRDPGRAHQGGSPSCCRSCVACQAPGGARSSRSANQRARSALSASRTCMCWRGRCSTLSERPRLLVFADNRQDAAFQAGMRYRSPRPLPVARAHVRADPRRRLDRQHGLRPRPRPRGRPRPVARAAPRGLAGGLPLDESGTKHRGRSRSSSCGSRSSAELATRA